MLIALPTTGCEVTLKEWFTHGMECAYKDALTGGVGFVVQGGSHVVKTIPGGALDRAAEAALSLMIQSVKKDGQDLPFSSDWFRDLPEKDFAILRDHIEKKRAENEEEKTVGKKNSR